VQSLTELLTSGADLTGAQVEHAVTQLTSTEVPDGEKAAFLQGLRAKGETALEIAAFAHSLLERAVDPGIEPGNVPGPMIDVCGTGGDKLDLFNISTAAMFLLAAAGACVVKHGNRAITSKCGGADVLEELGVKIDLAPERLRECVERHGLGFVFAPGYHPAFKAIGPVRRALAEQGIPTIFNLLGPLLNPTRPAHQLVGIFSPALLPKYAEALAVLGRARAWAVHGSGMDELSLCGPTDVREVREGLVRERRVDPAELGLALCEIEDLQGGNRVINAEILLGILDGTVRGPRADIVALNAAAGLVITGIATDLVEGLALAREQIANGKARGKLEALREG
jgi:anthranilate phosphoribosyltransferase